MEGIGKGRSPAVKLKRLEEAFPKLRSNFKGLGTKVQSTEFETQLRCEHTRQAVSSTWASVSPYLMRGG